MAYGAPPLFRQGVSARARFLFFLMLSLAAILVDGRLRSLDGLRSTVVSFTSPIVEAIHLPGRILGEGQGYFMSKRRLNEEVQQENESLRRLINTVPRAADKVATAEVIGRIADPFSRRIQINIGSREGVEVGMPVIGPFGVLGQISRVVNRLSEVTLLTDHTIRLSVINRRTGAFFILSGTGDDALSVLFALPSADIRPGDELITSGLDNLFPKAILAARVTATSYQPGEPYQRVEAAAVADVEDIQFATVVLANPNPAAGLEEVAAPSRFERRSRR